MKKIFLVLLTLGCFTACSDDDNNDVDNGLHNPYTGTVNGDWRTKQISTSDYIITSNCENDIIAEANYYYSFNADGSVDVYNYCDNNGDIHNQIPLTTGTYQTTGNVFTITIAGQEGKAHMVDYLDEYNALELRFDIGSSGLFYGYDITIEQQP
ncbi:hypothetical protein [Flavobacterium rhizosphaerae]|uniref:Lipocalin-like domain-containing protein n=1 Tax=Flavobacterium rhizosphaerae TaxID=3163298 RepID=A0ABW8YS21_9FLAO